MAPAWFLSAVMWSGHSPRASVRSWRRAEPWGRLAAPSQRPGPVVEGCAPAAPRPARRPPGPASPAGRPPVSAPAREARWRHLLGEALQAPGRCRCRCRGGPWRHAVPTPRTRAGPFPGRIGAPCTTVAGGLDSRACEPGQLPPSSGAAIPPPGTLALGKEPWMLRAGHAPPYTFPP